MTYTECLDFLYSSLPMYQRTGAAAYKNDLGASLEFDRIHGHPHRSFRSIHIAGTNGKGSVSHMLASVLQEAGYKTGLYTSPHLVDFRERIRVNGQMIPREEVIRYVEDNQTLFSSLKASFFEMTVDLAFLYFAKEKVDFAVIETGMGGRLDSTNIILPELSVITNIGLDHTRFLGETLGAIAGEKAGIIKDGVPVVIGEYQEPTLPVFEARAKECNSELQIADKNFSVELATLTPERLLHLRILDILNDNLLELSCDLTGKYQEKNILTLLESLETLKNQGINIPSKAITMGLKKVRVNTGLRGRWEEIGHNPLIICDTGHNAEGISIIVEQLKNTPYHKLHIVWGMVSDKNTARILRLLPANAEYYFSKADIPRSLNERVLCEMAREYGLQGKTYARAIDALNAARKVADTRDMIFIGGSTFLVGEILESFS